MGAANDQDDLTRRRERGRRSQAAFRKRQAQSVQALSIQNDALKKSIQKAINATHGDERPEMLNALRDLAEAAELDIPSTLAGEIISHKKDRLPEKPITEISSNMTGGAWEDVCLSLGPSPATQYRLDCGVWLDPLHYLRVSLPPQDILPYLGPGAESFAGILFWSVMEHSQSGCARHGPEALIKTGLGHSTPTKSIAPSFIQTMAKARIEYKQTGAISQAHAVAAEDDLGLVLCKLVEADYRSQGKDPNQWLSCVAIEQRVKNKIGHSALSTLTEVALGHADVLFQHLLDEVQCKLYDTSVCFGDGPRWDVEIVDDLFAALIGHILGMKKHVCD
ncbi:hypothetical protein BKA59DRAFT_122104 [Fusarium tricinctum]|uniref:BZIP domain-containing protein n=1 Tax=Fusarium tricinctum TaxID=61284 RepID=A0A8K0WGZ3_9HYPO|nr:hypothetical protein BKA59DRAFT_122104 [Fusarium tricinctum]